MNHTGRSAAELTRIRFDVPVEEYTTPNPVTALETAHVEELERLMKEHGIRHLPIVRGSAVVGIVSERDLKVVTGLQLAEKLSVRAADIMARDPVSVDANSTIDGVALEMSSRKIGSVLVTEGDQLLGIFTVTDALNALIEISREARKS
jgi:acetoin utilization protein AcuB